MSVFYNFFLALIDRIWAQPTKHFSRIVIHKFLYLFDPLFAETTYVHAFGYESSYQPVIILIAATLIRSAAVCIKILYTHFLNCLRIRKLRPIVTCYAFEHLREFTPVYPSKPFKSLHYWRTALFLFLIYQVWTA